MSVPWLCINSPDDQYNQEGDVVSLQMTAGNFVGDPATYSATGLPPGLSIDPNSGLISGTIATGSQAYQTFATTVTATCGSSSISTNFGWYINDPITFTNPGNQTNNPGDTVSLPIQATDNEGGTLTYSATGLPSGLAIDPNTGLISGTLAAGSTANGPFLTTVTASDGVDSSQVTFQWFINLGLSGHGSTPPPPISGGQPIGPITPITVGNPGLSDSGSSGSLPSESDTLANPGSSSLGSSGSVAVASSPSVKTTAYNGLPMLIFVVGGPSSSLASLTWSVDSSRPPTNSGSLPVVNFLGDDSAFIGRDSLLFSPLGTPVLRTGPRICRFQVRKILTNWRKTLRGPGRREILPPVRRMISSR